jgi:hypothetical protein
MFLSINTPIIIMITGDKSIGKGSKISKNERSIKKQKERQRLTDRIFSIQSLEGKIGYS